MGRLTKKPIILDQGVAFTREGRTLVFVGPQGEKRLTVLPDVLLEEDGGRIMIRTERATKQGAINEGTMWSLVKNAIQGVSRGFLKVLEINGIGYRANMEGKTLVLALGYSHPVRFDTPAGITITVEKNILKISGADKELVGRVAADIRELKKPEPYKGKGIKYQDEVIKRKVGKKAAVAGG